MDHDQRSGRREFDREVAVRNRIERVRTQRFETELGGHALPIDGEAGTGERGAAERQAVDAMAAIDQTLGVAGEHRFIGEQVMAQGHRLRDLQMRVTGHDRVGVLFCEVDQRGAQGAQALGHRVDDVA